MAFAQVAGTGFEGRADKIKKWCKVGIKAFLKREPNNKYDENAIKVFIKAKPFFGLIGSRNKHIGYIKADRAKKIAKKIDEGKQFSCTVSKVYAPSNIKFPEVTIEFKEI